MAYENLCMYCFQDLNGESICPHCGKDARAAVPSIQMLPGTTVYHDRFLLGRALGQDSNGIVYTALDTKRGGTIRIREYLPRSCAERLPDGSVAPVSGMEEAFDAGMKKLRMSVESVEDPRKRHFYFEENGTAYIAQRKSAAAAEAAEEADDDDGSDRRRQITLYIAIGAAVVIAVAIGVILLLNAFSGTDDVTLPNALPGASASAGATWMPAETPTPTPYTTATFAALLDPELSWMDYTYDGDVNSDFENQSTAAPTKVPTVDTNTSYSTVKKSSSSSDITKLQKRLIELGWLGNGSATGKYDAATKQAVKDFQTYVNNNCSPARKLAVDGIAGEKTQQWLYSASVSIAKPTATPRPTATPKPLVTPAPDDTVVNASSSKSEIRSLQNKLIALGLLPEGSADGKFGSTTATAVRNFQIRVNQLLDYEALDPTGEVDENTMAYLNYYIEWWKDQQKATATPKATTKPTATVKPTATGDGSVSASSSAKEIRAVQNKLIQVGALAEGEADGAYGTKTANAVKKFQAWVNQLRGEETLNTNGICDKLTQRYLDYCIENNRSMSTQAPVDIPTATPAPTSAPTQSPTKAPTEEPEPTETPYEPEPDTGEEDVVVDAYSDTVSIKRVQQMLNSVGLLAGDDVNGDYSATTQNAVLTFQQYINQVNGSQLLPETGTCDAQTLQYLEQYSEDGINIGEDSGDSSSDDGGVHAGSDSESIYAMQEKLWGIGLLEQDNVDGDYGENTYEAVRKLQQYVNDVQGEEILEVTGDCDALTMQYLNYCFGNGWNMGDTGDEPETDTPDATADTEHGEEVEETEAPEETEESVSEISNFSLQFDGSEVGSSVELTAGEYNVSWSADGVERFYVRLYNSDGTLIKKADKANLTGFNLDTSAMRANETYQLQIGALPVGGTEDDIVWKTLDLTLAQEEETAEPVITEAPTEEPTEAPVASVDAPVINIGSTVYQEDGIPYISDSTIIFSWMASGDVDHYTVTLVYEDGTSYSLGETRDTSKTVKTDQLIPGLYTIYVSATPVGGSDEDSVQSQLSFGVPGSGEPEATEEPDAGGEIGSDSGSSEMTDIQKAQMALYRRGLLDSDNVEVGVLDQTTVAAIAEFQSRFNEAYGADLPIIDPENPVLDSDTLAYLLDEGFVLE